MSHRSGYVGWHPVTGEVRETSAPAGDRTTPARGRAGDSYQRGPPHPGQRIVHP